MNKQWTRIFVALMALALFGAACGDDSGSENTDPPSDEAPADETPDDPVEDDPAEPGVAPVPSPYCTGDCLEAVTLQADPLSIECTVGLSWNSAGHPFGANAISRSEDAAAEFFPNMTLLAGEGQGDSLTQVSQIEDLLVQGIDVLIVSPTDAAALTPVVEQAKEQGVQVIASDRNVDTDVATYIGADNVLAGEVAGTHISDLLGGEGKLVVLQGSLGASPTIDRQAGLLNTLADGIEVLADQTANYDRAEGLVVMEDYLQRFGPGEIDAVFTHNDEMSLGAIQAIEEAGRADEIAVVGIDAQESALDAVEDGSYAATVVYAIPSPEHLLAAAKLCAGESLPERIVNAAVLVTADNVDDIRGTTF